jgi:hypothetical protein
MAVARYLLELPRSELEEEETVDKPKELLDFIEWEVFWEQWKTYMGQLRGAAKCPLTYIFRDHAQVDPALYLLPYADHDSRLVNTTELLGPWFEIENHCVYDKFKALVLKGPGWSFVKAFDRTRNGREAVLALKCQCEGTSAIQSRKAAAYAKIASARYNGHKKTFTFDNYVEMHQNAHNTLSELDEPVPETKKVTDFLAGITDSRLGNAKDLILGDPNKLQNFEACQQYLKTLVYNKTTQEKHERQISGAQLQQGQGKGKGGDGKSKNTNGKRSSDGIDDSKVVAKQYTRAEWFKLTPEQRKKIKELRAAKRSKGQTNRNASGVQVDHPDSQSIADLSVSVPLTQPTATQSPTPPSTLRNNGLTPPTTARSVKLAQRG